jgi:hypothetical protein
MCRFWPGWGSNIFNTNFLSLNRDAFSLNDKNAISTKNKIIITHIILLF